MKTRFFLAALLLLVFGSLKAQDTITVPIKGDTIQVVMPDMSELPELMRELGVTLEKLSDSVDWKKFERDMERWGDAMERWGRKIEQWGERYEKKHGETYRFECPKKKDPQVRSVQVVGSGDVRIEQALGQFSVRCGDKIPSQHRVVNNTLILSGSGDYEVAMQQLDEISLCSSGDVIGRGVIQGNNLRIVVLGSGDLWMTVDYDTISVQMVGSGDVELKGQCKVLYADLTGSGDLQITQLRCDETYANAKGSGEVLANRSREVLMQRLNWERKTKERSLLFNPRWGGFEAGLNMFLKTPPDVVNTNNGAQGMEIRPLRSWYFGFNIADVGVAFSKKHTAGIFTGIGIGWNNFSWNNDVKIEFDNDNVVYTLVPIDEDKIVKNSKFGALFLQVPLMFEVRPTRRMYIDAGVTGGLRIAQWNRVKFADGTQVKRYYGASINQFKLDASLRVGGRNLGFFANYALLPLFDTRSSKVHPINFGFSINF